jgi:NAD(P)-dependent dehydrogenase (short-subunit alcohol dehydrogenase family)
MMPALRAALPSGGGDGRPRIVMVGSVSGRIAGPMLGAYSASKFGLAALSDSLRAELAPSGIRVALIEPGPIATPIWQRSGETGDRIIEQLPPEARELYAKQVSMIRAVAAQSAKRGLPPDRVAKVIRHALTSDHPKARYLVGPQAHVGALLSRLSFRLTRRLTAARG